MTLDLRNFSIALIFSMALVFIAIWAWSLNQVLEENNLRQSEAHKQLWQAQIAQLQQKQNLWLQSQSYLVSTLLQSRSQGQHLQTFLWGYYQRNPDILSVSLIEFDESGGIKESSSNPGCLDPEKVRRQDFEAFLLPTISSCRFEDKVLLEIVAPVFLSERRSILIVTMDYLSFLREFSILTDRRFQPGKLISDTLLIQQLSEPDRSNEEITIDLVDKAELLARLKLNWQSPSYINFVSRYILPVVILLIIIASLICGLFYLGLLRPLHDLAVKMHDFSSEHRGPKKRLLSYPQTGLSLMHEDFHALQNMARLDAVTGLDNRMIFEGRLMQAISEGKRSGRKYALVLLDLLNLSNISRQFGQYEADGLLRQVAELLVSSLRETDNISRFDKNIFAVLLEVHDHDQLANLVEKIYLSIAKTFKVYGRELDVSAALGIAIYPEHGADPEQLYHSASSALLDAQRNEWPIVFYRADETEADYSGFTVIQALRKAIDDDELKLVFQPVISLKDHSTAYFEALLRWKDPEKHEISIERTIQLAEKNQLIKPLTNWIILVTCKLLGQLKIDDLVIGINLSMIDLHDQYLPRRFETCLNQYGIKPRQIAIEITEGQIMQEPDKVIETLAHLGVMGLSLSIDDFGTGQASLTYLKELPVEKLKIDQSFVRDIVSNADDQLIVKATIELAHTLDLKVIAEGVETVEVHDMLRDMNCDYVQGYYISRPIEADKIARWYTHSVSPG